MPSIISHNYSCLYNYKEMFMGNKNTGLFSFTYMACTAKELNSDWNFINAIMIILETSKFNHWINKGLIIIN